jgi:hypothetical protein
MFHVGSNFKGTNYKLPNLKQDVQFAFVVWINQSYVTIFYSQKLRMLECECIVLKMLLFQVKDVPSIINVMINPSADRKPQNYTWLTESKLWKWTVCKK